MAAVLALMISQGLNLTKRLGFPNASSIPCEIMVIAKFQIKA